MPQENDKSVGVAFILRFTLLLKGICLKVVDIASNMLIYPAALIIWLVYYIMDDDVRVWIVSTLFTILAIYGLCKLVV